MKDLGFRQLPAPLLLLGWGIVLVMSIHAWVALPVRSFVFEWLMGGLLLFPLLPLVLNRRAARELFISSAHCPPFHQDQVGQIRVEVATFGSGAVGDVRVQAYDTKQYCDVEPGSPVRVNLEVSEHARGVYPLPPITLATTFPFGLFASSRSPSVAGECIVYPAVEPNAPVWPNPPLADAAPSRSGEEVVALRGYRTGDAMNTVDWKASARTQELVVREYEHPRTQTVAFSFEQVRSIELEAGLSRLAAWVVRAHANGLNYSLELEGHCLPAGRTLAHRHECLTALACFHQEAS